MPMCMGIIVRMLYIVYDIYSILCTLYIYIALQAGRAANCPALPPTCTFGTAEVAGVCDVGTADNELDAPFQLRVTCVTQASGDMATVVPKVLSRKGR
jgi:hypothetical protein